MKGHLTRNPRTGSGPPAMGAAKRSLAAPHALLARLRVSFFALAAATAGWAVGCAPKPMMEPAFASRTYTPARIAVMPPAVFMVYDEFGDNDPQKSWQLGVGVSQQLVPLLASELGRRGYD